MTISSLSYHLKWRQSFVHLERNNKMSHICEKEIKHDVLTKMFVEGNLTNLNK